MTEHADKAVPVPPEAASQPESRLKGIATETVSRLVIAGGLPEALDVRKGVERSAQEIEAAVKDTTHRKLMYTAAARVSLESRTTDWKGVELEDQFTKFNNNFTGWVKEITAADRPDRDENIRLLNAVGIKTDDFDGDDWKTSKKQVYARNAGGELASYTVDAIPAVEAFREKYNSGQDDSVGAFIEDLSEKLGNDPEAVNKALEGDFGKILITFGKTQSADVLVKNLTIAKAVREAAQNDADPEHQSHLELIRKNSVEEVGDDREKEALTALAKKQKEIIDARQTEQSQNQENLVIIERLKNAWELLRDEYPEFRSYDLIYFTDEQEEKDLLTGRYHHPDQPGEKPTIFIRKDFKPAFDAIRKGPEVININIIAGKLGIPPEEMTDDILAVHVLIHEAGHGHDYQGMTKEQVTQRADDAKKELPAKNLREFKAKYPDATEDQIREFIIKYRNTTTEAAADDFATEFFRKHPEFKVPGNSVQNEPGETAQSATDTGQSSEQTPQEPLPKVSFNEKYTDQDGKTYTVISLGGSLPLALKGDDLKLYIGTEAQQILKRSTSKETEPQEEIIKDSQAPEGNEGIAETAQNEEIRLAAQALGRPLNATEMNIISHGATSEELTEIIRYEVNANFDKAVEKALSSGKDELKLDSNLELFQVLNRLGQNKEGVELLTRHLAGFKKAQELNMQPVHVVTIQRENGTITYALRMEGRKPKNADGTELSETEMQKLYDELNQATKDVAEKQTDTAQTGQGNLPDGAADTSGTSSESSPGTSGNDQSSTATEGQTGQADETAQTNPEPDSPEDTETVARGGIDDHNDQTDTGEFQGGTQGEDQDSENGVDNGEVDGGADGGADNETSADE